MFKIKENKINILGINISNQKEADLFLRIDEFLSSGKFNYIVTPNPEIILAAQNNEEFFNILNRANLSISDGIGLKFASWLLFSNLHRMTGADLTSYLLHYAATKRIKVAVVNWKKSLSKKADIENFLVKRFPDLQFIVKDCEREGESDLREIVDFKPQILFSSFGAPFQEMFIYKKVKNLTSVRIALGIGGAFDFLTQKIKRAPLWVRKIGIEWLWRIFQEPPGRKLWRLKRIFQAIVVFPLKFFHWRLILPFSYRKNVLCLVYKKSGDKIKVLIVERKDEENHWQLIQGGVEGDSIEEAAKKEIREELNIDDLNIIKVTNYFYKYKFPKNNVHRGSTNSRHAGYKGQKQALVIAKFNGQDEKIKVNYWDHSNWKWIELDELIEAVHLCRKDVTKIIYQMAKKELEKNGDLS